MIDQRKDLGIISSICMYNERGNRHCQKQKAKVNIDNLEMSIAYFIQ